MKEIITKIILLLNVMLFTTACNASAVFNKLGWFVFFVMVMVVIYLAIQKNKDKEESWGEE